MVLIEPIVIITIVNIYSIQIGDQKSVQYPQNVIVFEIVCNWLKNFMTLAYTRITTIQRVRSRLKSNDKIHQLLDELN